MGGMIVNRWFREDIRCTLIAAANADGFVADTSSQGASGAVGQDEFNDWIKHYLVPVLGRYELGKDNSIAIMDNASTHMSDDVKT